MKDKNWERGEGEISKFQNTFLKNGKETPQNK